MPKLHLKVVTPERVLMDEDVKSVTLPTPEGQITVLINHIPLVTMLSPGEIIVRGEKSQKIGLVYGGFVYVEESGQITVLADSAEHLEELNEKEIVEAKKRAEELRRNAGTNIGQQAEAEAALARSIAQLRTIKRHRHTAPKNIKIDQS